MGEAYHIGDEKVHSCVYVFRFTFCDLDGTRDEIDTGHAPTRIGKRQTRGPAAAAEIKCTAGLMSPDVSYNFWRDDTVVPGWAAPIPQMKTYSAEEVHLCAIVTFVFDVLYIKV